jgi:hypothetical protein
MAQFKTLRQKERNYVFQVYDNKKSENPARAIFLRFPFSDELFPLGSQKSILESDILNDFENSDKEEIVKKIVDQMIENINKNRFDHETFLHECVDHFEDFLFGEIEIKTVDDFINTIPLEAQVKISKDLYNYGKTEDEFLMGN